MTKEEKMESWRNQKQENIDFAGLDHFNGTSYFGRLDNKFEGIFIDALNEQ